MSEIHLQIVSNYRICELRFKHARFNFDKAASARVTLSSPSVGSLTVHNSGSLIDPAYQIPMFQPSSRRSTIFEGLLANMYSNQNIFRLVYNLNHNVLGGPIRFCREAFACLAQTFMSRI